MGSLILTAQLKLLNSNLFGAWDALALWSVGLGFGACRVDQSLGVQGAKGLGLYILGFRGFLK